jgi:TolB-like protein
MMFKFSALDRIFNISHRRYNRLFSTFCAALMLSAVSSCAMLDSETTEVAEVEEAQQSSQSAEEQLASLQEQMKSMKADWEQQKPALGRLISSEEDLQFLIKTLSEMSELDDAPSRAAYLGKVEKTPQQEDALQTLHSVVDNQDQLLGLIKGLSEIIEQMKTPGAPAQYSTMASPTTSYPDSSSIAGMSGDGMSAESGSSMESQVSTNSAMEQGSAQENCNCNSAGSEVLTSQSDNAKGKSAEWFGMTEPFTEAAPAGSNVRVSQLDSADARAGEPIPGLAVKQFKRRNLPSEMAAAGIDMRPYITAPQFEQSRKSLNDYVSQLAFKLAGNQQLAGNKVGVASFVFFDEQLEQTSSVGNQLAEQLSTVLPEYGALVVEYKLTREITVSPTGDLSLSRNTKKLRDSQGMDYVLTGTMVPTRRGLQINSRVVSTRNNLVIASATTLIPAILLGQL